MHSEDAQVLSTKVMNLPENGAIERAIKIVPPAQSEPGFYSRYVLVPKKDGGLRPILDLRLLNHALVKRSVQDDHFVADPLANMPRELVHVAGSERRLLTYQGSPPSRTILEIRILRGGVSIQVPHV